MSPDLSLICTRQLGMAQRNFWAERGISLRVLPLIQSRAIPFTLPAQAPDWVIFTSQHGVEGLFAHEGRTDFLAKAQIAAIGPKTAQLIESKGYAVSHQAANGAALAQRLIRTCTPQEVYYCCSENRRPELPQLLQQAGFRVREIHTYQTTRLPQKIAWQTESGALFFSPSAVQAYFQLNPWPVEKTAFAIGPTTALALRQQGVKKRVVATQATMESMYAAVCSTFQRSDSL